MATKKSAPSKKPAVKSEPKSNQGPKVNKSAWIRSQPADMKAKDLVAKAKAEGITLSEAQVYTARSSAKKSDAPKGKPGRPKLVNVPTAVAGSQAPQRALGTFLDAVKGVGGLDAAAQLIAQLRAVR